MILAVVVAALLVLFLSMRGIAGFYTDFLWFQALDLTGVWTGVLGARVALAAIFIAVFFVIMYANLWFADRVAPRFRPMGPEEELLERYHETVGSRPGLVRAAVAGVLAVLAGVGTSAQWQSWILFTNRQDFGVDDPLFNTDLGFYVFQLPFLTFVVGWLFWSLITVFLITAVAHYINGGIRMQVTGERATPQVKAHLSLLLAAMALVRAVGYWLDRYELTVSSRGHVDGALYTDVNAQLPALHLLLLISLFAAGLFVVNIWRRGWALPGVAVGLWAFASIVVSGIYPAVIQRFQVEPAESNREAEYIAHNIEFTRYGMGLHDVDRQVFDYNTDLTGEDIINNQETVRNIRLLDPRIVEDTYERLQAERGYYQFNDLDLDRYMIDDQLTQVVIASRDLNPSGVPNPSWEARTLTYTHGYGLAMAPASAIDPSGRPNFVVGDLPVRVDDSLDFEIDRPELYFGENLPGYAIVRTERNEVSFERPGADADVTTTYQGEGGVPMGSFFRRVAFALRFGDVEPVISGYINSESQILYIRDVADRVRTVAPFIAFDADPYPVVANGGVYYVVDGYTTTNRLPYGQPANTEQVTAGSGLNRDFNYVRNSVKAVVDAYDGTVVLYVIDDEDPIARAYAQAFPELFAPLEDMPEDMVNNLRYPEDLFTVQTNMWGRYHLEDPFEFYAQDQAWQVSQDPGATVDGSGGNVTVVTNVEGEQTGTRERRIDPYYLLMRLPGETEQSFVMLRPFVPISQADERKELQAFMVAKSEIEEYGRLVVYEPPSVIDGPAIVNANMLSQQEIASHISLLNREGSRVRLGNLILVPIEQSILYVRPLYVQAAGQTQVPELRNVIVAFGNEIVMADSLAEALEELFGVLPETGEDPEFIEGDPDDVDPGDEDPDDEGPDGEEDDGTPPTTTEPLIPGTVEELLNQADDLFAEADAALREGDLGEYQRLVSEARQLLSQALTRIEEDQAPPPPPPETTET